MHLSLKESKIFLWKYGKVKVRPNNHSNKRNLIKTIFIKASKINKDRKDKQISK